MKKLISQHLTVGGAETGTYNLTGDYATTATVVSINPPAGSRYAITRLFYGISDGAGVNTETYGALAALTAGIEIYVSDGDGIIYYLTDKNAPVKSNAEWAHLMYDQTYITLAGGEKHIVGRWSFDKFSGSVDGIVLDGDKGQFLALKCNDTMTGISIHAFLVQGHVMEGPVPAGQGA